MYPKNGKMIVRSRYRGSDPTTCCIAHRDAARSYTVLTFRNGNVVDRDVVPLENKSTLEKSLENYRGTVFVDKRTDRNLIPALRTQQDTEQIDFSTMLRSKSDEEHLAIDLLELQAKRLAENAFSPSYRGTLKDANVSVRTEKRETPGFVEYRAACRDERGRVGDMTHHVPKTKAWEARLYRAATGIKSAEALLSAGCSREEYDAALLEKMNPTEDIVYGNVANQTGFRGVEDNIAWTDTRPYDRIKMAFALGDPQGNVAIIYRGSHLVSPPPPPRPPPPPVTKSAPPAPMRGAAEVDLFGVEEPLQLF